MLNSTGAYINPENYNNEILYAGVSLSVGKGLLMNERMAALQTAKEMNNLSKAQQNNLINNLLFDAIKKYWEWVEAYNDILIFEQYVYLNEVRFNSELLNYQHGDASAIDTLEAHNNMEARYLKLLNYKQKYQELSFELSNFLWKENNVPIVLSDSVIPPLFEKVKMEALQPLTIEPEFDFVNHPSLVSIGSKKEIFLIERQLKKEYLKPTIDLKYNYLYQNKFNYVPFSADYQYGINFSFPLFLREARGDLNMNLSKIKMLENETAEVNLKLKNKLNAVNTNFRNTYVQIQKGSREIVNNYDKLLDAENTKFINGESSLFLVNSRENKLIEYQIYLMEYYKKYYTFYYETYWTQGTLTELDYSTP